MRVWVSGFFIFGLTALLLAQAQRYGATPEFKAWVEHIRAERSDLKVEDWRPERSDVVPATRVPRAKFPIRGQATQFLN